MPLPIGGGIFAFRRFTPNTPQPPRHCTFWAAQPKRSPKLNPRSRGEALSGRSPRGLARAHPRSRGEHAAERWGRGVDDGSSPLTRGALNVLLGFTWHGGLIPAHAGSTHTRRINSLTGWAHPRSRGEHKVETITAERRSGSSPLTRGAPPQLFRSSQRVGLIPAHAGSTWRSVLR